MPDHINIDHDDLDAVLDDQAENIEDARVGVDAGAGIDAETAAVLGESDAEDEDEDDKDADRVESGRAANDEARRVGSEGARDIGGVDTELASGGASGAGGGAGGMASPTAFDSYRSQMPTSQVNPMQYANYMPTPATATQYDMNNSPNRAALQAAILDAVRDGSGAPGDSRPRAGGGRLGGLSDDEHDRAAQEIQQQYVDSD